MNAPAPVPAPPRAPCDGPTPSVRLILGVVGDAHGLTRAELRSPQRAPKIVRARWIAMALARRLTAQSLPAIGRACGGFDHTTVMHAVAAIEELARVDAGVAAQLRELGVECLALARSHAALGLRMDGEVDAEAAARRVVASSRAATQVSVAKIEALAEAVVQAAATPAVAEADALREARRRERRLEARLARARARLAALGERVVAFHQATEALRGKSGEDAAIGRTAQAEAYRTLMTTQAATAGAAQADETQADDTGDNHGKT